MTQANLQRTSSWVAADIYQPDTNRMFVRTSSGKCYQYDNVPNHIYDQYDQAPSQGTAINSFIKNNYQQAEITVAEFEQYSMLVKIDPDGKSFSGTNRRKKNIAIFKTRIPGFYVVPACMY